MVLHSAFSPRRSRDGLPRYVMRPALPLRLKASAKSVFRPEGRCDRSLARSAWKAPLQRTVP
jgi:hypothetical protein